MADSHARIAAIEAELDELALAVESCRKTALAGRLVAVAGLFFLLLATWRVEGLLLVVGVASSLGGFVFAGSTGATRIQLLSRLAALDVERAEIIRSLPMNEVSQG